LELNFYNSEIKSKKPVQVKKGNGIEKLTHLRLDFGKITGSTNPVPVIMKFLCCSKKIVAVVIGFREY